jgi:hypothetical protein
MPSALRVAGEPGCGFAASATPFCPTTMTLLSIVVRFRPAMTPPPEVTKRERSICAP